MYCKIGKYSHKKKSKKAIKSDLSVAYSAKKHASLWLIQYSFFPTPLQSKTPTGQNLFEIVNRFIVF